MKLSVVLATLNEEKAVGNVISGIKRATDNKTEIIVVDSSTNHTPEISQEIRDNNAGLIINCNGVELVNAISIITKDKLMRTYYCENSIRLSRRYNLEEIFNNSLQNSLH